VDRSLRCKRIHLNLSREVLFQLKKLLRRLALSMRLKLMTETFSSALYETCQKYCKLHDEASNSSPSSTLLHPHQQPPFSTIGLIDMAVSMGPHGSLVFVVVDDDADGDDDEDGGDDDDGD